MQNNSWPILISVAFVGALVGFGAAIGLQWQTSGAQSTMVQLPDNFADVLAEKISANRSAETFPSIEPSKEFTDKIAEALLERLWANQNANHENSTIKFSNEFAEQLANALVEKVSAKWQSTARQWESQTSGAIEADSTPVLTIGKTHKFDENEITFVKSKIENPTLEWRGIWAGDPKPSANECLVVTISVQNNHNRKVLKLNNFPNVKMVDDVGNAISTQEFENSYYPIGRYWDAKDLLPQTGFTGSFYFEKPLPNTEHILLTMDLADFGGTGKLNLKILPSDWE